MLGGVFKWFALSPLIDKLVPPSRDAEWQPPHAYFFSLDRLLLRDGYPSVSICC